MIPPIVPILDADAGVAALIGTKIFQDIAPTGTVAPFAVWTLITAQPENYLSEPPGIDNFQVQVDCYGANGAQSRLVARAVQTALVGHATQVRIGIVGKDFDSDLWRYGFDWSFWTPRP